MSNAVREAIRRFRDGEIVVVTDDDDRENEGDLVCAASPCTPEKMAFIIRHTCGIVCIPLTEARARALNLTPMVATNDAPLGTAFTVSVDVVHGLTTESRPSSAPTPPARSRTPTSARRTSSAPATSSRSSRAGAAC
jgi:3,4-dihydroxy 2-butanone 4-phosphate synthase / GTP cyclohydrolase II